MTKKAPLDPEAFVVWLATRPDDFSFKEAKRFAELSRQQSVRVVGFKPENHPVCSAAELVRGKKEAHERFQRGLIQFRGPFGPTYQVWLSWSIADDVAARERGI